MRTNIKRIRKTLVAEEEVTKFLKWARFNCKPVSRENWDRVLVTAREEGALDARTLLRKLENQKIRKVINE
jgi:hypothetical protein